MVIGQRFAWAHLPKAAGTTTDQMFRLFPELVEFADPQEGDEKHATFPARRRMVQGRLLAMNLRRLPAWVISRANYVATRGVWPDYEPIPMPSAEELIESSFPDSRILLYTGDGRFEIDRWIRSERLAEDFLRFVSEFTDVDDERAGAVAAIAPANVEEYERRVEAWFTPEQVQILYESNPVWARLEAEVYGGLHDPVRG